MNITQTSLVVIFCACAFTVVQLVHSAPRRSGGGSTTFDQKQTGEYNIQLHLKDFQIIAVVGDDSFGSLGDYDYNYDYSDFTVKPSTSTTQKPVSFEPPTSASTTQNGDLSAVDFADVDLTAKPSPSTTKKPLTGITHPYPIISPSTTTRPSISPSTTTTTTSTTTEKALKPSLPSVNGVELEHVEKVSTSTTPASSPSPSPSTTAKIITSITPTVSIATTTPKVKVSSSPRPSAATSGATGTNTSSKPPEAIPGQIPVVVQDFSLHRDETPLVKDKSTEYLKDKRADAVTSVTIVPQDDANLGEVAVNEQPTLGEILHYRRCAQGYQRDKRGRCRKVRRPPIPMGLTRFASNLAARFRQAESTPANIDDVHGDTLIS